MITIQTYSDTDAWLALRVKVMACGTDNPNVFGGTNYGGYLLQQNPTEFASLVCFLKDNGPFNYYVEVGSASGGNLRFIHETVGFYRAFVFDDMMHPHAIHQGSNSWGFGEKITRYVGDSHREEAGVMFNRWIEGKNIDCAFIDGDHSVNGVLKDYYMLKPFFTPRSLLIFHDTHSIPDIGIATNKLIESKEISPVAHFVAPTNTCGIMVAKPIRN